jgi:hypothetical protein
LSFDSQVIPVSIPSEYFLWKGNILANDIGKQLPPEVSDWLSGHFTAVIDANFNVSTIH